MSFMDELKKLTQPYDDDEDFFEGADESARASAAAVSSAQAEFESTFGEEAPAAEEQSVKKAPKTSEGSLLGALSGALTGKKYTPKPAKAPLRERTVNFGGGETQVILFNPKTFDEAGELVNHILQGRSVVMTLEGIANDNARRLLDFMSGIAFALQGKITPVSAKTYFVTPQNVDLVGPQNEQTESSENYF